jgi:signal transduction histidine kinase
MRLRSLITLFAAAMLTILSIVSVIAFRELGIFSAAERQAHTFNQLERSALDLAAAAVRFSHEPDPAHADTLKRASATLSTAASKTSNQTVADGEIARAMAVLNHRILLVADCLRRAARPALCSPADGVTRLSGLTGELLTLSAQLRELIEPTNALRFAQAMLSKKRASIALFAIFLCVMVISAGFWAVLDNRLLRPLDALRAGFAQIGAGALDHRLAAPRQSEYGQLARAFNTMASDLQRITASRAELEKEVSQRAALEEDLRQRNAQLVQMNIELDAFARIASHDLRAPLRGVAALAGWLEEDIGDACAPETRHHFALLVGRVNRLAALLDSLQRYTDVGRLAHAVEAVDPGELIGRLRSLIDPENLFAIQFQGPAAPFFTCATPLETALEELLLNAVKHHDRGAGAVCVRLAHDGSWRVFTVTDDGPGVPPDLQERIFELFQTLRPRDDVEGSGMGLALIRKAARIYGGILEVRSPVRDGRGCAFTLRWPSRPDPARV